MMKLTVLLQTYFNRAWAEVKAMSLLCLLMLIGCSSFAQNGLNFQGGQVVDAGAGSALNITTGTWEAWINPQALGNRRVFFKEMAPGQGVGMYELFINSTQGNVMRAAVRIGGISYDAIGNTVPPLNAWTHVAATFDGLQLKLYVNGVLEGIVGATGPMDPGTGNLGIGANVTGSPGAAFIGTMDEVRVWNVARTQAQIQADMSHELCGNENGLALYYNFNQGVAGGNNTSVTSAPDVAGGDNNGTLTGFTLNSSTNNWVSGNSLPHCTLLAVTSNNNSIPAGQTVPSVLNNTDFGVVAVNASSTKTYTITNSGINPVTINNIAVSGADAGLFTVTNAPTSIAAGGGTGTFNVTFSPGSGGVKTATVTINNTSVDVPVYSFAIQGGTSTTGASLNFDGIDDYVAGTYFARPANHTVEAWVKLNDNGPHCIASWANNSTYQFGAVTIDAACLRYYHFAGGAYTMVAGTTALNITDNQWHHVAATFATVGSNYEINLYVDGELKTTGTGVNVALPNLNTFKVGAMSWGPFPSWFFQGNLDDVRVWNYVRNCAEIYGTKNCELAGNESGLLACYKFNQGIADGSNPSVNTLLDASANGYTGVLQNFTLNGSGGSNWVSTAGVTTGTSCSVTSFGLPDISVTGNGITIPDGNTAFSPTNNTNFGTVQANTSLARTFVISNAGPGTLYISGVSFSLSASSMFTASGVPATVAPGSTASFTVTFTPTSAGAKTATLEIYSNDCDTRLYNFNLRGTGCAPQTWYLDADNDNYYTGTAIVQCGTPGAGYKSSGLVGGGDCDDNNSAINPATTWYLDADNDTYYTGSGVAQCASPGAGYKYTGVTAGDCDDNNAALNPTTIWYLDADNDNYYTGLEVVQCTSPGAGYKYTGLVGSGDCDDANNAMNPGATEVCGNAIDENCNGILNEACPPITLTWTGYTSTNWHVATNWTPNTLPSPQDSVVIPLRPNQPALSTNTAVRSVRFNAANASITINSGSSLFVSANLSGNTNAKFIGTGTVTAIGNNVQLSNTITVNNLRVSGTFTLTNVAATRLDIIKTLEINNGTLNSNGKLFMKSTATSTASIVPIVNGAITGTVTQERYIGTGPVGYEYLATGVAGQTIASLSDDISVVFGNPASVQWYKESVPGDRTSYGWTSFAGLSSAIAPHQGVAAYMYARPRTIDYLGLPYQGNQNIPVTYTNGGQPTEDGFNLVANPYISDIDWDAPTGWTRTDIDPNIYILNPATNNNVSYNYITNIGFGGFNGKIANGQAFFVQAISSSAVLTASEDVKTSGAVFYKQDETLNTYLRMQVMGENGNGDEMLLGFAEQATDKFDRQLDAIKLANNYVDMSIAGNDGSSLSQQFIGNETESAIIPVLFNTNGETGKFTITMGNAASVNKEIYLRDNLTGALTNVHANTSYTFEVTTSNINQNQNRFDLVIGSTDLKAAMPAVKVEVFPNPARTQFNIALNGLADNASLKVYDVIGHIVYQQTGLTNSRYTINTGNWQAGVYMIEVTSDNIKTTQRLSVTD